jgi:hypothetical protein
VKLWRCRSVNNSCLAVDHVWLMMVRRIFRGRLLMVASISPVVAVALNEFEVFVPKWATRILIDASWMSVRYGANTNPQGHYWIEYGDEYRPYVAE